MHTLFPEMTPGPFKIPLSLVATTLIALFAVSIAHGASNPACGENPGAVQLSRPTEHELTLEGALRQRRSARNFSSRALSLEEISQLLWAAQGITDTASGKRTAPSSGSTYPITLYLSANNIDSLAPGLYRYQSECNRLVLVKPGDYRQRIFDNALRQRWAFTASAVVIFSANLSKIAAKYKNHPRDSALLEAGHISQNIYLQCASLDIGVVALGGFSREGMHTALELPKEEEVVYLNLIGHRRY
jgi:SagB-type dehydrogenase family enzyme